MPTARLRRWLPLALALLAQQVSGQDDGNELAHALRAGRWNSTAGGGGAFADKPAAAGPLVGLRYSTTLYSGNRVIASIQALYAGETAVVEGPVHGEVRGDVREVVAPAGTRIVGLEVCNGDLLDGFRLVCAQQTDGVIDVNAVHFGTWAGDAGDGWGTLIDATTGNTIVGIHGRCGSMIDALGLISKPMKQRTSDSKPRPPLLLPPLELGNHRNMVGVRQAAKTESDRAKRFAVNDVIKRDAQERWTRRGPCARRNSEHGL